MQASYSRRESRSSDQVFEVFAVFLRSLAQIVAGVRSHFALRESQKMSSTMEQKTKPRNTTIAILVPLYFPKVWRESKIPKPPSADGLPVQTPALQVHSPIGGDVLPRCLSSFNVFST